MTVLKVLANWWKALLVKVLVTLTGFVAVAIALPFSYRVGPRTYTTEDYWQMQRLPSWAWIWDNFSDGAMGDQRLWWHHNGIFGLPNTHWLSQYWWLAVRNPANNLRRHPLTSVDVSDCLVITKVGQKLVRDKPGQGGFQLVEALHAPTMKSYYGLYWVHEWNSEKAFVLRLGFKVEPRHTFTDWDAEKPHKRFKGFTFRCSPYNDIRG